MKRILIVFICDRIRKYKECQKEIIEKEDGYFSHKVKINITALETEVMKLESEIVEAAKEKADEIIKEAQEEAEKIKKEGEDFVRDLLSKIDDYLIRARKIIEEGINNLMEDRSSD